MHRTVRQGFTLVELLVVIGIIAMLIGILLPTLSKAKETANTVKCASNLRSIGQGLHMYATEYRGFFPAAYIYKNMKIANGVQTPDNAQDGYIHWSSFLYSDRTKSGPSIFLNLAGWGAFQCPSLERGGLPPTNTFEANLDPGQTNDNGKVIDEQAPRCAYTVNEAICPRNKFVVGFQGALRAYRFVNSGSIRNAASTILATEWIPNWRVVSDAGRLDPNQTVCKSHRPVHGFVGLTGELNMEKIAADVFANRPTYRRAVPADLNDNPGDGAASSTRLDWVGRNHGTGSYKNKRTNFLYVDGHVETKHIKNTLNPFEWGEKFYSLHPNSDIANAP